MELFQSEKKNEILPFATAWMELVRIMLSELSEQRKRNTVGYYLHVKFLKAINKQET